MITSLTDETLAQETGGLMVTGRVVNGTADGEVPTGVPIELHTRDELGRTTTYTGTIAPDATFTFDDLESEAGKEFVVSTTYQGLRYTSEPVVLSTDGGTEVEVKIYEVTADKANIRVEQAHFFLIPDEESVHIAEVYSVSNAGDRTYVGAQTALANRTTLSFALPREASNLNVPDSGPETRYVADASTLADTQPIMPGIATVEIRFSYQRPYREGMRLTRKLNVPIQSVLLIIQGGSLSAEGSGLSFNGAMETQMGNADSYLTGSLAAEETLDITIASQQSPTSMDDTRHSGTTGAPESQTWETLVGVAALAVAGLSTFALWAPAPIPEIPEWARPLLTAIARLDHLYANGEMDEIAYRAARSDLKHKLRSHLDPGEGLE